MFKKIEAYANKCGFENECNEHNRHSQCPESLSRLQLIEVLESLTRINEIFKKFPKEAKELAAGEISFLRYKGDEASEISQELMGDVAGAARQVVTGLSPLLCFTVST